ncbi:hypothetical protein KPH14_011157 [Odynerus spinipes]|uniref:Uncharacterized protein n=1 Tax=Odynerus spinipes TaxID=1348599 RepID=A0AAD9RFY3_9HYME|nr:hypothetical protein KPH14_011157 [Odynerus spinipes]
MWLEPFPQHRRTVIRSNGIATIFIGTKYKTKQTCRHLFHDVSLTDLLVHVDSERLTATVGRKVEHNVGGTFRDSREILC